METSRINDFERDVLVPLVCDLLTNANGRPLPSEVIAQSIRNIGHHTDTRSVRRVINHIRREGLVPCVASSPKGFFVASNEREITDCIYTLESLADSIHEVIEALKSQRFIKYNI